MNIKLLKIIILILSSAFLYTQKKTSIQPLPPEQSLSELYQVQPKVNPEYESVLNEYENLIRKYPDKKELFYNLGNLNYIGGDSESALQNYRNALLNEDPEKKAHTLYNMGNVYYNQGDLQKSIELFKEALKIAPDDEDIRHNFELSKLMLEQQPPQKNDDKNQDGKNGEEGDEKEQEQQKQQQSQEGDEEEQKKDSKEGQNENEDGEKQEESSGEENKEEKQSEQSQSKEDEEKPKESQDQQSQSQTQEEKEKQLGKEEAEAILNALKANESNMKRKKYKAVGRIKLEKDW